MIIRDERPGDDAAIGAVTAAAFAGKPFSDGSEPAIIDRLRRAGALTISLLAEDRDAIVGHVAFSPVTLSGGAVGWFALGPVAVAPLRQKGGIGSRLIGEGLDRLRRADAAGCVLAGNPAFYKRFGFANPDALSADGVPPEYLLVLPLRGPVPSGIVAFHPGFYGGAA